MTDELEARWHELMHSLGVNQGDGYKIYRKIKTYYGQSKRYYHNLAHVGFVLDKVGELAHLADNITVIELAAWFHDIVYNTRSDKNEEHSADMACKYLKKLGLEDELVDEVAELILATTHHIPKTIDQQILLDADLATFGVSPDQHADYSQAIRQEYWWVPEPIYKQKRIEILNSFLERDRLYSTEIMFDRYEQKARQNIAAEIEGLAL